MQRFELGDREEIRAANFLSVPKFNILGSQNREVNRESIDAS
jgi:hypothetical protein